MRLTQLPTYAFGSFILNLRRGALIGAGGREIPLRAKSFALLRLFIESADILLSHELIMEILWPGVFVTENNITQCISEIRAALGGEAHGILRTVARRGYVLTAEVVIIECGDAGSVSSSDACRVQRAGSEGPHCVQGPMGSAAS